LGAGLELERRGLFNVIANQGFDRDTRSARQSRRSKRLLDGLAATPQLPDAALGARVTGTSRGFAHPLFVFCQFSRPEASGNLCIYIFADQLPRNC